MEYASILACYQSDIRNWWYRVIVEQALKDQLYRGKVTGCLKVLGNALRVTYDVWDVFWWALTWCPVNMMNANKVVNHRISQVVVIFSYLFNKSSKAPQSLHGPKIHKNNSTEPNKNIMTWTTRVIQYSGTALTT